MPAILARLLLRSIKNSQYRHRWHERFGFHTDNKTNYDIWLHAVSLGETNAATPLVHELLQSHPHLRILITTMTPTGAQRVTTAFGNAVGHSYAPYDYPYAVKKFLDRVKPSVLILMETEIWPNTIHLCALRNIPVVMLNVRISEKSCRNYQRASWISRPTFCQIHSFGAQSKEHKQRLIALGANPDDISQTGSMKFEIKLTAGVREIAEAVRQDWFRLAKRLGLVTSRRTEQTGSLSNSVEILIADTLGELPVLYSASDIAFVGGSLLKGLGGHNILEPCAVGVPVVFGSSVLNFEEISQLAISSSAGIQAKNPEDLQTTLSGLLEDPNLRASMGEKGMALIAKNQGATEKSLQILLPLISHNFE